MNVLLIILHADAVQKVILKLPNRLIMNYLRKHMNPNTFQLILFLKHNRDFWKVEKVIDDMLGDQTLVEDESDDEEDDDEYDKE